MAHLIDVYLAGPITGLPNYNREAFLQAEEFLCGLGLTVFNPNKIEPNHQEALEKTDASRNQVAKVAHLLGPHHGGVLYPGYSVMDPQEQAVWEDAMRQSVSGLLRCSSMVLLPGWRESRGTQTEVALAKSLEIAIFELPEQ